MPTRSRLMSIFVGSLNAGGELTSSSISSTVTTGGIDSAQVINLIDSDYVQLRQTDIFRDSAFVTNICDSAYFTALGF
jgi:hypothetical protein